MNTFNSTLTLLTKLLLAPLAQWPLVALLVWSAVAGILMAVVFRFTSNQPAIRRAADRCRAEVLAIKLFQDDLLGIFTSLRALLWHSAARLWYSLPPMLLMLLPFVLVFMQLALRYERRPLMPGESTIVHLELEPERWEQTQHVQLQPPDGIVVEAGPVRNGNTNKISWRINVSDTSPAGTSPGSLQWKIADAFVGKQLATCSSGQPLQLVDPRRAGPDWRDQVLHPGEPGLPQASAVRGIVIDYPRRETLLFGFDIAWWITFLIVSMMAAFLLKPLVGVEF